MKFFMSFWNLGSLIWNWKNARLNDLDPVNERAASFGEDDPVKKPNLALGIDLKDETEREVALRNEPEGPDATNVDPSATLPVGGPGGSYATENTLVVGTDRDETINGRCGNDELYGSSGDDVISGGGGHDYLSGNRGDDTLIGGEGADTFSFDGDFDSDTILDFSRADGDRLDFIVYEEDQSDWTPETILDFFVQIGKDAVLQFPGSDEEVILSNVDASEISADLITVTNYVDTGDLVA